MDRGSILIVDDEAAVTMALESFFQTKGFKVSRAFYGDQAIEQIDKERPSAVILDLQMPGVDGIAVLEKICQSYPEVKTLVITGYSEQYQPDLDRLKPDVVRLKPISLEDLTREVETLLGQKETKPSSKKNPQEKIRLLFVGGVEDLYKRILKPYFEKPDRPVRYETALASELREAFQSVGQFHPHLVVLDGNRLPIGVDAGKFAAELSRTPTPPLEVIIHTIRISADTDPFSDEQLKNLENSIQQVAERHQLLPAS